MKGYKALNCDLSSKFGNMTYDLGTSYEFRDKLELGRNGYHFCQQLFDVFRFYEPIIKAKTYHIPKAIDAIFFVFRDQSVYFHIKNNPSGYNKINDAIIQPAFLYHGVLMIFSLDSVD